MSLQVFSGMENPPRFRSLVQTWLRSILRRGCQVSCCTLVAGASTERVHQECSGRPDNSRKQSCLLQTFSSSFYWTLWFPLAAGFTYSAMLCLLILAWKTHLERFLINQVLSFHSASLILSFMHLLLSQIYEGTNTNDSKERFQRIEISNFWLGVVWLRAVCWGFFGCFLIILWNHSSYWALRNSICHPR